jgi:flagellar hook-basal body complex protein FliE
MLPLPPLPSAGSAVHSSPIGPKTNTNAAQPQVRTATDEENPFEVLLKHANAHQLESDRAVEDLVTGKSDNIQQVVMQVVKAEMSFQLFMEVRNQLIESYNELMRMQF